MIDVAAPEGDPSVVTKNIAIAFRTAIILLLMWILVRAAWPTELFQTRLVELTFGGLVLGLFWLVLSLWIGGTLLAWMLRLPIRRRQFDFWCSFWIYSGVVVMCVYGVAFYLLTHPPRYGVFANIIFSVSVFLWSIVL